MPHPSTLRGLALAAAGLASFGSLATGQESTRPVANHPGEFVLTLAPRSLQRDPRIDLTVITEMTDAGRRLRAPTPEHPTYCVSLAAGYHDDGGGIRGLRPLPVSELQGRLDHALALSGFVPAREGHAATVAIVANWGSANGFDASADGGMATSAAASSGAFGASNSESASSIGWNSSETVAPVANRAFVARAALVGGNDFAAKLTTAMTKDGDAFSGTAGDHFMNESYANRQMVEQALHDNYYVVASAYDAQALAHGKRVLLWRTKMTTNSQGIAMGQALPSLLRAGSKYFGRDMRAVATLSAHLIPQGKVELGTPVRVSDSTP